MIEAQLPRPRRRRAYLPLLAEKVDLVCCSTVMARLLDGLKVLVVEDDADGRELLSVALEFYGADVCAVDGAEAARRMLARQIPHVLVSDIGMPGEDGYSLIQSVRKLAASGKRHMPAVALTAFTTAADRARALEAGFDSHIPKPVEPQVLAQLLRELVQTSSGSLPASTGSLPASN
jgi:CheY-like chemotaxis protein